MCADAVSSARSDCFLQTRAPSSKVAPLTIKWCDVELCNSDYEEPFDSGLQINEFVDVAHQGTHNAHAAPSDCTTAASPDANGQTKHFSDNAASSDLLAVQDAARCRLNTYRALGVDHQSYAEVYFAALCQPARGASSSTEHSVCCPRLEAILLELVTPGVAAAAIACAVDLVCHPSGTTFTGPSDQFGRCDQHGGFLPLTACETLLLQECQLSGATSAAHLCKVLNAARHNQTCFLPHVWTGVFSASRVDNQACKDARRSRRRK